jgi:hypothetical protein
MIENSRELKQLGNKLHPFHLYHRTDSWILKVSFHLTAVIRVTH